MITQEKLKELFIYDPESGNFIRKKSTKGVYSGTIAGYKRKDKYIVISINHKIYYAHRLAWLYIHGINPINDIDHIDHNTSNNKIDNLRHVTRSENLQNQIKSHADNKSTKLLGVTFNKHLKKYTAEIYVREKRIKLGIFNTDEDAHYAYVKAKRIYHSTCTI